MKYAAVLLVVFVGACASSGGTRTPPADRDRISAAEIAASNLRTAYDLVQQLRPRWLTARGQDSFRNDNPLVVYLDGARLGGIPQLREINCAAVQEILFLDAMKATQLYGTGHRGGAIIVKSRSGS